MELWASDNNPIPKGATVGSVLSSGGVNLRYAHWRAGTRRPKGTVCIVQGRAESIEKYFETIENLRERGFVVASFDLRGQGGSDRPLPNRRKGHVDSFAEYDDDLETFMREVALPDCPPPYFALAHSTGALVCLRVARAGAVQFSRMVLVSPLLGLGTGGLPPTLISRLSTLATALGLGEIGVPGTEASALDRLTFEENRVTGDRQRFERNQASVRENDAIAVGGPTFGWLYAACSAIAEARDSSFATDIRVPSLIVSGAQDTVVSVVAMERLANTIRGGGLISLRGAQHEIMMERDSVRDQFWAAFDAFVPGSP